MTITTTHVITIDDSPDGTVGGRTWMRACSCGYRSTKWSYRHYPEPKIGVCPRDDTPTALITCQMAWGGLLNAQPEGSVHLVRSAPCGTPGPTLCGIERFGPDAPGWSLGGGVDGPGMVHVPCAGCITAAREDFPGLPVVGMAALSAPLTAAIQELGATR